MMDRSEIRVRVRVCGLEGHGRKGMGRERDGKSARRISSVLSLKF